MQQHREYLSAIYTVAAEDERRMHDTFYGTLNVHWSVLGAIFVGAAYGYSSALPNLSLRGLGIIASAGGLLVSLAAWSGLNSVGRAYRRLIEAICFRALVEERLGMTLTQYADQPLVELDDTDACEQAIPEYLIRSVLLLGVAAPIVAVIGWRVPGVVATLLAMLLSVAWYISVWRHTRRIAQLRPELPGFEMPLRWSEEYLVPYNQAEYRRRFQTPHDMYKSSLVQDSPYARARLFFVVVLLLGFAGLTDGLGMVIRNAEPAFLPWRTVSGTESSTGSILPLMGAPASESDSTSAYPNAIRP